MAARDAVFAGVVLERHEGSDPFAAQDILLFVTASWKGGLSGRVWVHTPAIDAGCGYLFSMCSQYLVFGDWYDDQGTVFAHICSGTRSIEDFAVPLDELGMPEFLAPGPPQVCGLLNEVHGTWEVADAELSGLGAWDLLEFRNDGSGTGNWLQGGALAAIAIFSFRKTSSLTRADGNWSRISASPQQYSTWDAIASRWVRRGEIVTDETYLVSADGSQLVLSSDRDKPVLRYRRSTRRVAYLDGGNDQTATSMASWGEAKRSAARIGQGCQGEQPLTARQVRLTSRSAAGL
ncbi:hypothetical protein ACFL6X_03280 [Candidatus Latescibacterota bacterium]